MDGAVFLRSARLFVRHVYELGKALNPSRRENLYVVKPASTVSSSSSPNIIRQSIVPPADPGVLPCDIVPSEAECENCGACWVARRDDIYANWYNIDLSNVSLAGWSCHEQCPACGATHSVTVRRFRLREGWQGRQGWMVDRLTGRTVRYRNGWEENV